MARFERAIGVDPFEVIDYRPRGARVARSRLGESWLVLVSPYDPETVPGRYLAAHGEGFFLLSIGSDDVVQRLEQLEAAGIEVLDHRLRAGILDWRVADIGDIHGARIQLTQIDSADDEQH